MENDKTEKDGDGLDSLFAMMAVGDSPEPGTAVTKVNAEPTPAPFASETPQKSL